MTFRRFPNRTVLMCSIRIVIPIYKKSAGICTCYSSRPTRPSHCPIQSERATQKPTPICIMTLECTFDRQRRTKDINIPRRHLLLLCFGWILEFAKFCRAKNKTSSKRLFYICIFPTSLTSSCGSTGVENVAKIAI